MTQLSLLNSEQSSHEVTSQMSLEIESPRRRPLLMTSRTSEVLIRGDPSPDEDNQPSSLRSSQSITAPLIPDGSTRFYKTKMCPYLVQRGVCARASRCVYAHDVSELRELPNLEKTKLCPVFRKSGSCGNETCKFAHSQDELRHTDHYFKTRFCHMWKRGKCGSGNLCRHAHGSLDLRTPVLQTPTPQAAVRYTRTGHQRPPAPLLQSTLPNHPGTYTHFHLSWQLQQPPLMTSFPAVMEAAGDTSAPQTGLPTSLYSTGSSPFPLDSENMGTPLFPSYLQSNPYASAEYAAALLAQAIPNCSPLFPDEDISSPVPSPIMNTISGLPALDVVSSIAGDEPHTTVTNALYPHSDMIMPKSESSDDHQMASVLSHLAALRALQDVVHSCLSP